MNKEEARAWIRLTFGGPALDRLDAFASALLVEAQRQSLIARSTFGAIWSRHICDCAQLVPLAPATGLWLDIGSGGGLPGIVVAILRESSVLLVETRRKRAQFLRDVSEALGLKNITVYQSDVKEVRADPVVISARAVARLDDIFTWTRGVVSRGTLYLLPRGANAVTDLAVATQKWHGEFHVKQSITDPHAGIVIAKEVQPR